MAVKVLRLGQPGTRILDEPTIRMKKRSYREIDIWKTLHHPRILPLTGFAIVDDCPALISPFCENGNASQYLMANPQADRKTIVRHHRSEVSVPPLL